MRLRVSWQWEETDFTRYFGLHIDRIVGEYIDIYYSDKNGRVITGDIVIAYGTIAEDRDGDPILIADSIYFPTEMEIQDWLITRTYGDSEEADELRDALGTWQNGLDEFKQEFGIN